MIISIGIVEDNPDYAHVLQGLIEEWNRFQNYPVQFEIFFSGEGIMAELPSKFHVIFMDIQLPGIDGVEASRRLRQAGYNGEIIFLTAFHEHVFEGYEVRAMNYLLKPVTLEKLSVCMDAVLHSMFSESYIIRNRNQFETVLYKDIIYIYSQGHQVEITASDKKYRQTIHLKELIKHLPVQFIQCHRTAIINVNHIVRLDGHNVTMSDREIISISNTYLKEIQLKLESLII